jgi:hypothetical protein
LLYFAPEKINYADYVEKCIVDKECTSKLPTDYSFKVVTEQRFQLTFVGETFTIITEARQLQRMPSELIFAQCVLKTMRVSSLTYGIVRINNTVV